ncbi:MAG: (Fe-S)-binding protein [Promethearchaeota archaeon]
MNENQIIQKIESCLDCLQCLDYCDTYLVTGDELKSPNGRLKIANKIYNNEEITKEELISMYTCTLCEICDLVCTQKIPISEIIHASKAKLVELGKAPLEIHEKIIKGIIENDNSVNGKPEERLNWLPEKYKAKELFEQKDSDTLLFLGCMSSFRVKESASASYEILKKANYDFKILKNEPCCGEYVYSAGKIELAKKIMEDNFSLFKELGIKNILVTCAGCLYAFNKVYPKYIKDFNINVKHVIQVIYKLEKQGKIKLKPLNKRATYHDACRMGRKLENLKIYREPRELLEKTKTSIKELNKIEDDTPCCGAGSGVRGVDSSITIKIGSKIFEQVDAKLIISACPLCVFNYRYVNYKTQNNIESKYITDYLLDAIEKED